MRNGGVQEPLFYLDTPTSSQFWVDKAMKTSTRILIFRVPPEPLLFAWLPPRPVLKSIKILIKYLYSAHQRIMKQKFKISCIKKIRKIIKIHTNLKFMILKLRRMIKSILVNQRPGLILLRVIVYLMLVATSTVQLHCILVRNTPSNRELAPDIILDRKHHIRLILIWTKVMTRRLFVSI